MRYRVSHAVGALALPSLSSATLLYVTSYTGTGPSAVPGALTTLNLTISGYSAGSLQSIATSTECGAYPSWLTLVGSNLYCLDEAWNAPANGSLVSFQITDGKLSLLDKATTIGGPVSSVAYGADGHGLAVADYGASGFNTFNIANPADIVPIQASVWDLPQDQKDRNSARQKSPHPHQAILDPTGQFVLVPDLGLDRVHVFAVDRNNLKYTEQYPLLINPGSGPRHGVFVVAGTKILFYVIAEISNQIFGYDVLYMADGTLIFEQVWTSSTHGLNGTVPAGATGGEIAVSPDNKFLMVSSRGEASLSINNWDVTNSAKLPSDPLITFKIDFETGALDPVQTFAAGGLIPRHFSINKDGTLVASAAQGDGRVAIISRDPASGVLKEYVANIAIANVNFAIFAE
ncbi:Lactonase, 7-bladed beta-propeller domain containing protein [Rhypophila decipiens]